MKEKKGRELRRCRDLRISKEKAEILRRTEINRKKKEEKKKNRKNNNDS